MPYTVSHAIISLPVCSFTRNKIPLFSVIVGSISPDFPYLLVLSPTHAPGHSVLGVLIYCLVPSLIVLFFWYRWFEIPTLNLFHLPKRQRRFTANSYFLIIIGVLIGAYSHVLWDATSHSYGAIVVANDFMHREIFSLPLYKWNQYASGVLGLILLALWYVYSVFKNRQNAYQGHFVIGAGIYAVSILSFVVLANVIHGSQALSEYAVHSAVGVLSGGMVGAIIYSLIAHLPFILRAN